MSALENPYVETPGLTLIKVHGPVDANDYAFIKGIRPKSGTFSAVVSVLWLKLCNELRKRQITDFSSCDDFEHFVSNCVIIDGNEYASLRNDAAQWQGQLARGRGGLSDGPTGGTVSPSTPPLGRSDTEPTSVNSSSSSELPDVQIRSGNTGKGKKGKGRNAAEATKPG